MKTKHLSGRFLLALMAIMIALNAGALTETITGSNKLILKYSISGGKYIRTLGGNAHASIFEIEPGGTITITGANGRKQTKKDKFDYWIRASVYFEDAKGKVLGESHYKEQKNGNVQLQVIVPNGAVKAKASISLTCSDIYNDLGAEGEFTVKQKKNNSQSTTNQNKISYSAKETPVSFKCHEVDSKIRFNDFYGEVKYRCSLEEDDAFEFADLDAVLYENDLIQTEEESGAILGLYDMSTYVLKPESKLIICDTYDSRPTIVQKLEMLGGSLLTNFKKMAEGKSLEVEMSQCVCGIEGTIVVLEETGKESRVYLLVGKASVTNKKTGKITVLQPGQMVTMKGKTSNVASFNVEQVAKKFGCPMSEIKNHYTNKKAPKYNMSDICGKQVSSTGGKKTANPKAPQKKKSNKTVDNRKQSDVIKTSGNSQSGSSAPSGKYARYGAKRGIVKRVDEGDDIRMHITTWWDDYGRLERSEITGCEEKKGNKWVSSSYSQIINIIVDDKHYMYNKSIGWKQMKNNETNFLGSGAKTVNGCKLTKSGTATVAGKTCDVFKGKRNGTTIEYYIWEGVVMKHVEKDSDGTSTTTVQSIELPASIDSSKFAVPKTGAKKKKK
ncbi:MAG: FecR domain-containing protein [Muribaculaceae bacterium]|nr:FecR domain-containing protein [Muribaculaceae bacterium]